MCDVTLWEAEMTWADIDEVFLIGGSTRMPMVQEMITKISGKDINPAEVKPDDVVALGAAIRGNYFQWNSKLPIVNGATHNLGLVLHKTPGSDGYIHVMIPKMTPFPCEVKEQFRTAEHNQSLLRFKVVEGLEHGQQEDEFLKFEDFMLGECLLQLPPGLPVGSRIDVTFKYNLDQTLEVTAKGPDGRTANVMIERPTLDEAEVDKVTEHLQSLGVE